MTEVSSDVSSAAPAGAPRGGRRGPIFDFVLGVRLFGRGLSRYVRSPRTVLMGLVPALLSLIIFAVGFGLLIYFLPDLSTGVTWFADGWSPAARGALRVGAAIALVGAALLLFVISYTAVTLLVGDPFYEAIAERVEDELGGVPGEIQVPWWRGLWQSLVDSVRLLLVSVSITVPLFLLGLLPVVGQSVVPVIGAFVGGWFLAQELVSVAFSRRGLRLPDRRAALRRHRPVALGYGVAVFCTFLIPLGAVLTMPAAVIGGTLLARHTLGLSTE